MWKNEILNEIHQIREEHAKSFNYNLDAMFLDAMFADWQRRQSEGEREVVSLPPKRSLTKRLSGRVRDPGGDVEDANYN